MELFDFSILRDLRKKANLNIADVSAESGVADATMLSLVEFYAGFAEDADEERMSACLKDGLLTLVLPRRAKEEPRRIEVSLGK